MPSQDPTSSKQLQTWWAATHSLRSARKWLLSNHARFRTCRLWKTSCSRRTTESDGLLSLIRQVCSSSSSKTIRWSLTSCSRRSPWTSNANIRVVRKRWSTLVPRAAKRDASWMPRGDWASQSAPLSCTAWSTWSVKTCTQMFESIYGCEHLAPTSSWRVARITLIDTIPPRVKITTSRWKIVRPRPIHPSALSKLIRLVSALTLT